MGFQRAADDAGIDGGQLAACRLPAVSGVCSCVLRPCAAGGMRLQMGYVRAPGLLE